MKRLAVTLSLALVFAAAPGALAGQDRHMTISKTAAGVKGAIHAGSSACEADQPVKAQKKTASGWKTLKKKRTDGRGLYKFTLDLKPGKKYRTVSPANSAGGTSCAKVVSDGTVIG